MSNIVNFNLRLEKEIKEQASEIFENYGMTTAQALRMFLVNVVHTKKVPLTLDYQAVNQPSAKLQQAIDEAENDKIMAFESVEALMRAANARD